MIEHQYSENLIFSYSSVTGKIFIYEITQSGQKVFYEMEELDRKTVDKNLIQDLQVFKIKAEIKMEKLRKYQKIQTLTTPRK